MKPIPMLLACATTLALCAAPASAAPSTPPAPKVLTFDDLVGGGGMPSAYKGFSWTNWGYSDQNQAGLPYFANSPDTWLYANDNTSSVSRATPFVFTGAYFSGIAAARLHYELSLGGVVVASLPVFQPSDFASTWQASGFSGNVDRVSVISNASGVDHFAMDDFTYLPPGLANLPSPATPVPEPLSSDLMAGGLLLLLLARQGLAARSGH